LIRLIQLSVEDMQSVLQRLPAEVDQESAKQALMQPELVAMAGGSPGALLGHVKQWSRVSADLMGRLHALPTQPIEALGLARDLTEALDGEQQLWLINWLQQHHWRKQKNEHILRKLEKLRVQLLSFVQPRLAWEVTFLDLMRL
jgi:DNA polymerase-3 subunit delta'